MLRVAAMVLAKPDSPFFSSSSLMDIKGFHEKKTGQALGAVGEWLRGLKVDGADQARSSRGRRGKLVGAVRVRVGGVKGQGRHGKYGRRSQGWGGTRMNTSLHVNGTRKKKALDANKRRKEAHLVIGCCL